MWFVSSGDVLEVKNKSKNKSLMQHSIVNLKRTLVSANLLITIIYIYIYILAKPVRFAGLRKHILIDFLEFDPYDLGSGLRSNKDRWICLGHFG